MCKLIFFQCLYNSHFFSPKGNDSQFYKQWWTGIGGGGSGGWGDGSGGCGDGGDGGRAAICIPGVIVKLTWPSLGGMEYNTADRKFTGRSSWPKIGHFSFANEVSLNLYFPCCKCTNKNENAFCKSWSFFKYSWFQPYGLRKRFALSTSMRKALLDSFTDFTIVFWIIKPHTGWSVGIE